MPTPRAGEDPEAVRRFLAARDVPCPACSYNLRGLAALVCPECGIPISMDVLRLAVRRQGGPAVVIGGIGVMMFAVMALPTAAFFLLMAGGMMVGTRVGTFAASIAVLIGLGVTGLLLFGGPLLVARLWDRWEPGVAALSTGNRWAVAALCWSWVLLAPALILVLTLLSQ